MATTVLKNIKFGHKSALTWETTMKRKADVLIHLRE